MNVAKLGEPCPSNSLCPPSLDDPTGFQKLMLVRPLRPGDILSARFFAPKISNVNDPTETRDIGWRKLVRLRARPGSLAEQHQIDSAIILFNYFVAPGIKPFQAGAESVNTQVMLTSMALDDRDSIYWLDYGPRSKGGLLSKQLDATFDAADLQGGRSLSAVKPYYVPDGCIACHGNNPRKPLVNYLDTDHWFDRLNDDFSRVRAEGALVLFDAGTDDVTSPAFARAFDVVRQFNEETEEHAAVVQPNAFHLAAGRNWLRLHERSSAHLSPAERAVPTQTRWSASDAEAVGLLNRYCFRCHGTIKFNVFDKKEVMDRRALIRSRLFPTPEQLKLDPGFAMPSDRLLDEKERSRILALIR